MSSRSLLGTESVAFAAEITDMRSTVFPAPCLVKLPDLLDRAAERNKEKMSGKA